MGSKDSCLERVWNRWSVLGGSEMKITKAPEIKSLKPQEKQKEKNWLHALLIDTNQK